MVSLPWGPPASSQAVALQVGHHTLPHICECWGSKHTFSLMQQVLYQLSNLPSPFSFLLIVIWLWIKLLWPLGGVSCLPLPHTQRNPNQNSQCGETAPLSRALYLQISWNHCSVNKCVGAQWKECSRNELHGLHGQSLKEGDRETVSRINMVPHISECRHDLIHCRAAVVAVKWKKGTGNGHYLRKTPFSKGDLKILSNL